MEFRCAPPGEQFVVVGVVPTPSWAAKWRAEKATVTTHEFDKRDPPTGWIYTYRLLADGMRLGHITELEDGPPRALCHFRDEGKLLVGLGTRVRVYDLGKKRLLKKCETVMPLRGGAIVRLEHSGQWIFATDVTKGIQCLVYRPSENVLQLLVDDPVPRLMAGSRMIDR